MYIISLMQLLLLKTSLLLKSSSLLFKVRDVKLYQYNRNNIMYLHSSSSIMASNNNNNNNNNDNDNDKNNSNKIATIMHDVFNSEYQNTFSVYVTGGGSIALANILQVPGASNSFISGHIPYSHSALKELINDNDDSCGSCSSEMAVKISKAAYKKTIELVLDENNDLKALTNRNIFGIGCTAAIVSSQPKKGSHRCYVAASNYKENKIYSIQLEKGRRIRIDEDQVCGNLILDMIASNSNINSYSPFLFTNDIIYPSSSSSSSSSSNEIEVINESIIENNDIFDNIYSKKIGHALFIKRNSTVCNNNNNNNNNDNNILSDFDYYEDIKFPKNTIVYPGSFNPLHEGHVKLVVATIQKLALESPPLIIFEMSAINPDKPPIARDEILRRLKQFDPDNNILLKENGLTNIGVSITSLSLFFEKSQLFKNCNFLVGADTLVRLIDPKYYDHSINNMVSALSIINERNCKFVVGGRCVGDNFSTAEKILESEISKVLPDRIRSMFISLPEEEFRIDLSSTQIRNQNNNNNNNNNK